MTNRAFSTSDDKPRAYTEEEIRSKFIDKIYCILDFWENESRVTTVRDKMNGAVFSILAMLDGESIDIPGFKVSPIGTEEDRDYHLAERENYYPIEDVDIAGALHDTFVSDPRYNKSIKR